MNRSSSLFTFLSTLSEQKQQYVHFFVHCFQIPEVPAEQQADPAGLPAARGAAAEGEAAVCLLFCLLFKIPEVPAEQQADPAGLPANRGAAAEGEAAVP